MTLAQVAPDAPLRKYKGDNPVIAYDYREIEGASFCYRRTATDDEAGAPDVVVLGSAASFGRFVADPFPAQIQRATGVKVLNLGIGGARPGTYLAEPALIERVRSARVVIIEVMSARGYANDLLRPIGHLTNLVEVHRSFDPGGGFARFDQPVFINRVWTTAFRVLPPERVRDLILQSQAGYLEDMRRLKALCRVPIFLHIAQRGLPDRADQAQFFFPHLVTSAMLERIVSGADSRAVTSRVGLPMPLRNRVTGEPEALMPGWPDPTANDYYPAPEMHTFAAKKLTPLVKAALARPARALKPSEASPGQ